MTQYTTRDDEALAQAGLDGAEDEGLSAIERDHENAFYRAGMANMALRTIDDAIEALRRQRRALAANVRIQDRLFAEFRMAHPEIRDLEKRRRLSESLPLPLAAQPADDDGQRGDVRMGEG